MDNGQIVFIPKPELTLFNDTYLECEVIKSEPFNRCRLRVKSVRMGNGKQLPDLTAQNKDAIITEKKGKIFDSIQSMKLAVDI